MGHVVGLRHRTITVAIEGRPDQERSVFAVTTHENSFGVTDLWKTHSTPADNSEEGDACRGLNCSRRLPHGSWEH